MFTKPTAIIHHLGFCPYQYRHEVLDEALEKLRIKTEAAKLMKLYASCPEGFRPSTTYILERTGIKQNNVARARAKLAQYGLLGFVDNKIYIDWSQIRVLASLDPKLMGSPHKAFISPVELPKKPEGGLTEDQLDLLMHFNELLDHNASA